MDPSTSTNYGQNDAEEPDPQTTRQFNINDTPPISLTTFDDILRIEKLDKQGITKIEKWKSLPFLSKEVPKTSRARIKQKWFREGYQNEPLLSHEDNQLLFEHRDDAPFLPESASLQEKRAKVKAIRTGEEVVVEKESAQIEFLEKQLTEMLNDPDANMLEKEELRYRLKEEREKIRLANTTNPAQNGQRIASVRQNYDPNESVYDFLKKKHGALRAMNSFHGARGARALDAAPRAVVAQSSPQMVRKQQKSPRSGFVEAHGAEEHGLARGAQRPGALGAHGAPGAHGNAPNQQDVNGAQRAHQPAHGAEEQGAPGAHSNAPNQQALHPGAPGAPSHQSAPGAHSNAQRAHPQPAHGAEEQRAPGARGNAQRAQPQAAQRATIQQDAPGAQEDAHAQRPGAHSNAPAYQTAQAARRAHPQVARGATIQQYAIRARPNAPAHGAPTPFLPRRAAERIYRRTDIQAHPSSSYNQFLQTMSPSYQDRVTRAQQLAQSPLHANEVPRLPAISIRAQGALRTPQSAPGMKRKAAEDEDAPRAPSAPVPFNEPVGAMDAPAPDEEMAEDLVVREQLEPVVTDQDAQNALVAPRESVAVLAPAEDAPNDSGAQDAPPAHDAPDAPVSPAARRAQDALLAPANLAPAEDALLAPAHDDEVASDGLLDQDVLLDEDAPNDFGALDAPLAPIAPDAPDAPPAPEEQNAPPAHGAQDAPPAHDAPPAPPAPIAPDAPNAPPAPVALPVSINDRTTESVSPGGISQLSHSSSAPGAAPPAPRAQTAQLAPVAQPARTPEQRAAQSAPAPTPRSERATPQAPGAQSDSRVPRRRGMLSRTPPQLIRECSVKQELLDEVLEIIDDGPKKLPEPPELFETHLEAIVRAFAHLTGFEHHLEPMSQERRAEFYETFRRLAETPTDGLGHVAEQAEELRELRELFEFPVIEKGRLPCQHTAKAEVGTFVTLKPDFLEQMRRTTSEGFCSIPTCSPIIEPVKAKKTVVKLPKYLALIRQNHYENEEDEVETEICLMPDLVTVSDSAFDPIKSSETIMRALKLQCNDEDDKEQLDMALQSCSGAHLKRISHLNEPGKPMHKMVFTNGSERSLFKSISWWLTGNIELMDVIENLVYEYKDEHDVDDEQAVANVLHCKIAIWEMKEEVWRYIWPEDAANPGRCSILGSLFLMKDEQRGKECYSRVTDVSKAKCLYRLRGLVTKNRELNKFVCQNMSSQSNEQNLILAHATLMLYSRL